METVLRRVNDFVDDDLLSCFLWAAGENAVATPGWESPSVNPLKGIPLPPSMPPLPPPAGQGGGSSLPPLPMPASSSMPPPPLPAKRPAPAPPGKDIDDDDDDDDGLGGIRDADDDDIDAISKMSGVPLTKEQKLTQRMQRKAVSARVARLRKKDYVTGLEEQIKELTAQVAQLRETNGAAGGAVAPKPAVQVAPAVQEPALREEGERELSHMGQLLQQPQVDRLEVNATVEKYVANKRAQQRMVSEYLDSIEDILSPAAPLQVAFNPETGSDDAFAASAAAASVPPSGSDEGNGNGGDAQEAKRQRRESVGAQLMSTMASELGLQPAQIAGLSQQKDAIRADREMVAACMQDIRTLRARMAEHVNNSQRVTEELRRILEPTQVARFLLWVERNHRSMNLLNSMAAPDME